MIRKAELKDLIVLDQIARRVANDLHQHGIDQWSDTYPGIKNFQADLENNGLLVYDRDGVILGSVTIKDTSDEVYREVTWIYQKPAVIHRMMVEPKEMRNKIGTKLMEFAIERIKKAGFDSIRVDTHPDNYRMKAFLTGFGFVPRGYLPTINRDAYELRLGE